MFFVYVVLSCSVFYLSHDSLLTKNKQLTSLSGSPVCQGWSCMEHMCTSSVIERWTVRGRADIVYATGSQSDNRAPTNKEKRRRVSERTRVYCGSRFCIFTIISSLCFIRSVLCLRSKFGADGWNTGTVRQVETRRAVVNVVVVRTAVFGNPPLAEHLVNNFHTSAITWT